MHSKEGITLKKLICLLLTLLMVVFYTGMAMAATDDEIIDDPLQSPDYETVTGDVYGEFEEEIIPEAGPPAGEILAQTGGIPAEVFYVIGGICVLSAVFLLGKKPKTYDK